LSVPPMFGSTGNLSSAARVVTVCRKRPSNHGIGLIVRCYKIITYGIAASYNTTSSSFTNQLTKKLLKLVKNRMLYLEIRQGMGSTYIQYYFPWTILKKIHFSAKIQGLVHLSSPENSVRGDILETELFGCSQVVGIIITHYRRWINTRLFIRFGMSLCIELVGPI